MVSVGVPFLSTTNDPDNVSASAVLSYPLFERFISDIFLYVSLILSQSFTSIFHVPDDSTQEKILLFSEPAMLSMFIFPV